MGDVVFTDSEELPLGDVYLRGRRHSRRRAPRGSHVVATDSETSLLGDVHLRGGRRSRRRAPREPHVVVTDPKELLLGDVHLRVGDARVGERAEGRWAALGSRLWQELPSNLGSSFVALGRVNRRNRHVTCLGSGSTFRMKH